MTADKLKEIIAALFAVLTPLVSAIPGVGPFAAMLVGFLASYLESDAVIAQLLVWIGQSSGTLTGIVDKIFTFLESKYRGPLYHAILEHLRNMVDEAVINAIKGKLTFKLAA
jgi:hypothetical protein